ncbi:cupredoxin domain-containing protein [Paenibacillus validus]|uniref:cupredoxin domain-containing protein n=2 Tax=Paenibacillus TaxID=44249 RepID=UPI003D2BDE32
MAGMMAAMVQGMTIGLGVGTLLVIWLPGEIFHATIISMLIGGIIGTVSGIPISIMAILDGLLSGIMGGMMGTMFMVMIPTSYTIAAIKIMSVLCTGVLFLLFLMLQGEIKLEHLQKRSSLLSKPVSMFAVIVLFAVIIILGVGSDLHNNYYGKQYNNTADPNATHEHQLEKNLPDLSKNELAIIANEFSFSPSTIHMNANEKIKIILYNAGNVEHDFEIVGTDIHVHAKPGQRSSVIATLEKTGEYRAVCTLPGHQEAGMISAVRVHPL